MLSILLSNLKDYFDLPTSGVCEEILARAAFINYLSSVCIFSFSCQDLTSIFKICHVMSRFTCVLSGYFWLNRGLFLGNKLITTVCQDISKTCGRRISH